MTEESAFVLSCQAILLLNFELTPRVLSLSSNIHQFFTFLTNFF